MHKEAFPCDFPDDETETAAGVCATAVVTLTISTSEMGPMLRTFILISTTTGGPGG